MKNSTMKNPGHVSTFYSTGSYSVENNLIEMYTEIPRIELSGPYGKAYSLSLTHHYDISTKHVTCLLIIYGHGHPTDRTKLTMENRGWDKNELDLKDVFPDKNFQGERILVITVHDEDFEEWHKEVYKFYVQNHVTYDEKANEFEFDIHPLQEFIDGSFVHIQVEEDPRTVAGGVLDPA
jgi:hypothetical protein